MWDGGTDARGTFAPRDVPTAKKLVVVLTAAATAVTLFFAVFDPSEGGGRTTTALSVVGPTAVLVLAVCLALIPDPPDWLWFAYPFVATVGIVVTDLGSHDARLTGQVFFLFPVLFAGAQLQRSAAWALCVVTLVGELVVALGTDSKVVDSGYMAAVLATTTAILVQEADRIDALVFRLREQAAVDPLTGLATRRVLDEAATASLVSAAGHHGTALILVDIDHFKQVNDEHGHPVGDLVLTRVAETLRRAKRRTDVLSRMGGDELAVLLLDCSLEAAIERAHLLLESIRSLRIEAGPLSMATDSGTLRLTASVGLAHLPTHATGVHDLYRAADISLYEAKRGGRNRLGHHAPPGLSTTAR